MKNKSTTHISIVVPVYGCVKSLDKLYTRLIDSLSSITDNIEIILVDDRSPDNAWREISRLAKIDDRVKGIKLSRNFGQAKATIAGLDYAQGDWVVVMDCDLQDQPEEIIKLYNKAQEGYDIVFGKRVNRQDKFLKKISSIIFHKVYAYLTDTKVDSTISNFSIISKKVSNALKMYREQNRTYSVFISLVGFNRTEVDIEHAQREEGKSSYTFKKLLSLATDGIVARSNKPLKISIKFGFIMSLLSFIYALWLIVRYMMFGVSVAGWTSVMVSVYLIGGLLFMNLGFIGLYIGKTFDETKKRPRYIVDEITDDKRN